MKRMLFNATYQEELRVASVEGQRLINFDIETTSKEQRRGNIYKGIVTRVEPSLEACFVDYGTGKQGFLPFKEIDNSYLPQASRFRDFARLPEGTELIIQVEKDERGNKGAALTTYVSLPGRYLVLMPNNSRSGGISRRIDGEERDELKTVLSNLGVPNGMSVIARTAALGRVHEELQWDLNYLLRLWDAVKNAWNNQKGSFLIYQESNLVIRSIRDHFSPDIAELLIDMEDIYEQAQQFMSNVMPNYVNRVKLYRDDVPLFSRFQIEHQIETAYSRSVNLPSGGSIVIDHTEALTAVDVNSAKSNKGADIESTALTTNMEAAEEIARQLRLRDLGGLVVVDFIDMENLRNQREVENCFKQQLSFDRARIQMGKLSKFGLLELSRQRLQASLEESTTISCPRCAGTGVIRGTESIAIHILRIIQEEVVKNGNYIAAMHVQLPVEVATYLLNEKRDDVAKIERRMKVRIVLIPNVQLDSPHYKIRKIANDGYESGLNKVSYNLVEHIEDSGQNYIRNDKKVADMQPAKAMVKHLTPVAPAPIVAPVSSVTQLVNKSWNVLKSLFSVKDEVVTKVGRNTHPHDRRTKLIERNTQSVKPSSPSGSKSSPASNSNSSSQQRGRTNGGSKNNTKMQQTVRGTNASSVNNSNTNNSVSKTNSAIQVEPLVDKQTINRNKSFLVSAKVADSQTSGVNCIDDNNQLDARGHGSRQNSSRSRNTNHVSRENQSTPEIKKHTASSTNNLIKEVVHVVIPVVDLSPEVLPSPKIVEVSPPIVKLEAVVVERKNTIFDPIDLGLLELVATNPSEILRFSELSLPIDLSQKRYNDIVRVKVELQDINYQLVETKAQREVL